MNKEKIEDFEVFELSDAELNDVVGGLNMSKINELGIKVLVNKQGRKAFYIQTVAPGGIGHKPIPEDKMNIFLAKNAEKYQLSLQTTDGKWLKMSADQIRELL